MSPLNYSNFIKISLKQGQSPINHHFSASSLCQKQKKTGCHHCDHLNQPFKNKGNKMYMVQSPKCLYLWLFWYKAKYNPQFMDYRSWLEKGENCYTIFCLSKYTRSLYGLRVHTPPDRPCEVISHRLKGTMFGKWVAGTAPLSCTHARRLSECQIWPLAERFVSSFAGSKHRQKSMTGPDTDNNIWGPYTGKYYLFHIRKFQIQAIR